MDWVSCVRFSPNSQNPVIVSCGWDKLVKASGWVGMVIGYLRADHPW